MYKKYISYYHPHRLLFFLDLLAAVIMSSIDLVFPMISRRIIDDYIPNQQIDMMIRLGVIIALLFIVKSLCNYFINYWGHVMGARIERDMRADLFNHFLTLSFSFFDKNKTGKLMSRLVNDLHEISEMAHHAPEDLFISFLMIGGSFVLLMTINVQLTLILMVMLAVLISFSIFKRRKMRLAFRSRRESTAVINAQIENALSGIRLAQSYANESFEEYKFGNANNNLYKSQKYAFQSMGEFIAGTHFISDVMNLSIIILGGIFAMRGEITTGELVAFLLFTTFFMRPVRQIVNMIQQIQSGMSGFERLYEMLNIKPDIKLIDKPVIKDKLKGNIHFQAVSFSYEDNQPVLEKLNLEIPQGKHVALVGPSGVGKSTITNLIPRFYDVTAGTITIDDTDIRHYDLEFLRKQIGIVQQDVFMFHGTIKENILYGNPDATDQQVIEAAKRAHIDDFISGLPSGYDTVVGERGVRLSGGQKQRLSIARVFLKNPPIVILDEATSSLDNESERYVQVALDELAKGKTTVTVAHRLTTVMNADEILVLKGSRVVEQGSHEALLAKKGMYYQLYTAQFKGYLPDALADYHN